MRSPFAGPRITACAALAAGLMLAAPGGALAAQTNVVKGDGSPLLRGGTLLDATPSVPARAAAAAGAGRLGYGGATPQSRPIAMQATRSRRRVTLFSIDWSGGCSDGDEIRVTTKMPRMRAARTGRFRRAVTETQAEDDGLITFENRVSGTLRPGRAAGTFRTVVTATDRSGGMLWRCDSGSLRFSVPRAYAGLTAQGYPLAIRVSSNGRRLQGAVLALAAPCARAGHGYQAAGELPLRGPIDGRGRFDASAPLTSDAGQYTINQSRRLTGTLRAGRGAGSLHVHADVYDKGTGAKVDECDTGEVTWSAAR